MASTETPSKKKNDPTVRASVSLFSVVLATSISAGIGILFGLFPALRAARLNPIRALRNE